MDAAIPAVAPERRISVRQLITFRSLRGSWFVLVPFCFGTGWTLGAVFALTPARSCRGPTPLTRPGPGVAREARLSRTETGWTRPGDVG
jgi:hypothetical protein